MTRQNRVGDSNEGTCTFFDGVDVGGEILSTAVDMAGGKVVVGREQETRREFGDVLMKNTESRDANHDDKSPS